MSLWWLQWILIAIHFHTKTVFMVIVWLKHTEHIDAQDKWNMLPVWFENFLRKCFILSLCLSSTFWLVTLDIYVKSSWPKFLFSIKDETTSLLTVTFNTYSGLSVWCFCVRSHLRSSIVALQQNRMHWKKDFFLFLKYCYFTGFKLLSHTIWLIGTQSAIFFHSMSIKFRNVLILTRCISNL